MTARAASKMAPRRPKRHPREPLDGPRGPQDGPKRPPRRSRRPPRRPKRTPRAPQGGPERPPRRPPKGPDGARAPQDCPRRPQEAPRKPQRGPKEAQEAPKRPPRRPQEAPKRPDNDLTVRAPDVHPAKREESTSGSDVLPEAGRAAERKPYCNLSFVSKYYIIATCCNYYTLLCLPPLPPRHFRRPKDDGPPLGPKNVGKPMEKQ